MNFLLKDLDIDAATKRRDRHLNNLCDYVIGRIRDVAPATSFQTKAVIPVCEHYKKNIDLIASGNHFIEFKSISHSFGKNFNNRVEELAGQCQLLSNLGKMSYIFVYHDRGEKFTHYERLRGIMKELIFQGSLHSAILIKVGAREALEDTELNMKSFLNTWQADND